MCSGYPIEQLAEKSTFLETAYLLLYGELPSSQQFSLFEGEVLHHTYVHRDLDSIIAAFPFNAHPSTSSLLSCRTRANAHSVSILTSSFAALGAFAPEANPSLQGQKLYTAGTTDSLAVIDKQIFRLLGKSISLAA